MRVQSWLLSILLSVVVTSYGHAAGLCAQVFTKPFSDMPLIEMDPQYKGEDSGKYIDPRFGYPWFVKYFNETEKKEFELHLKDGEFYDSTGQKAESVYDRENLNFDHSLFVIDAEGRFYAMPFERRAVYHHSSLTGGKPVLYAGTVAFSEGEIREISDASGHYKPKPRQTLMMLRGLYQMGVNLKRVRLTGGILPYFKVQHSLPLRSKWEEIEPILNSNQSLSEISIQK